MNLMQASHQWAARPDDERFISLTALNEHCQDARRRSQGKVLSIRKLECDAVSSDSRSLVVNGPNGVAATLSNWSFGQLATKAGAPAGYLRSLPGALAADCINVGLMKQDAEDCGLLLYRPEDYGVNGVGPQIRAVTGPNYGRVWNSTITQALVQQFGDGVTGAFRVPGEFGKAVDVTKRNTTLYASDRDMFVFLADEEHKITIPNRRDGQSGELSRGFFLWNSEVGSQSFGIATFLFDYVCQNRIVWGATEYAEIRLRHTSSAPDRWLEEIRPAINSMANSSTSNITRAIADARAARIDNVDEFLIRRKYSKNTVAAIKAAHFADEQRPMESAWDVATGITAYARELPFQNERVDFERDAGKILDMAA